MKFKLTDSFESSCLQGAVDAHYGDLVQCFGEPNSNGDEYKVQKEWMISFEDGTYATIYDWKEGDNYNGEGNGTHYTLVKDWHIGGQSQAAVRAVTATLDDYLNGIIEAEAVDISKQLLIGA